MGFSRYKRLVACFFLFALLVRRSVISSSSSMMDMADIALAMDKLMQSQQQQQGLVPAETGPRPQLPPFPWQWIHPMKTGTSFGNMLYMLSCPEEFRANWTEQDIARHSVTKDNGIPEATSACRERWRHGTTFNYMVNMARPPRPQWWLGEHAWRNPTLTDATYCKLPKVNGPFCWKNKRMSCRSARC